MARYKLTLEYAGTRYSGWQIQQNARTVQGELNRALADIARGGKLDSYGAGRTDAGVHALGQVAHVDLGVELPPATLVARVNDALPHDINVLAAERVPARFHARHSAVARSYLYQIARRRTAFAKPFVWWVRDALDVEAMRAAGEGILGLARLPCVHRRRPRGEVHAGAHAAGRRRDRSVTSCSSASSARTFSGRWCAASSACSSPSDGRICRLATSRDFSCRRRICPRDSPRHRRASSWSRVFYDEPPLDLELEPAVFGRTR